MDVAYFLGVAVLITIGVFLNGWRFARMTSNPFAGVKLFGQPIEGSELSVAQLNRLGRLQMISAPIVLIFVAVIATQV